jgi:hypothetical protein
MPTIDRCLALLAVLTACVPPPSPELDVGSTGLDAETDAAGLPDADASTGPAVDEDPPPEGCDPLQHECREAPPDPWQGPVAMLEFAVDEPRPACGPPFNRAEDLALARDLRGSEHACACDCGPAQGVACEGIAIVRHTDAAHPDCATAPGHFVTTSFPYTGELGAGPMYWRAEAEDLHVHAGTCEVIDRSVVGVPRFEVSAVACGLSAAARDMLHCDPDEPELWCVPRTDLPYAPGACIWRDGDVPCPDDSPFRERTVYHQGWSDDRRCSDCDCTAPAGECVDPSITLAYWMFEYVDTATVPADGACHLEALLGAPYEMVNTVELDGGVPDAACAVPTGSGEAFGRLAATDPVTVCCS